MKYTAKQLVTGPTSEPLSLSDAKKFLRVTDSSENTLLEDLIKFVRVAAENYMGIYLMPQTWKLFFDDWPEDDDYFELFMGNIQEVTHIKHKSTAGVLTSAISSSLYISDLDSNPAKIFLGYDQTWPSTELYPVNPIEIQVIAGYDPDGSPAVEVPADIVTMLKVGLERIYDRPDESYDKMLKAAWENIGQNYKAIGL